MKLSIRYFVLSFLILVTLAEVISLYKFYYKEKSTIAHLASLSVKDSILNVYNIAKTALQKDNTLNKVKAKIDSIKIDNNFIKNIIITNKKNKILYLSNRTNNSIPKKICSNIRHFDANGILVYDVCKKNIELYRGIKRYVYTLYIIIDKKHINDLVFEALESAISHFLIYIFAIFLIMRILFEKFLILPLEKLRQFAYYHTQKPKEFFIKELESIRYSLAVTFERLEKEQLELYNLSTKDSLSGLYNRLSLFEKIDWLISKNKRDHDKFAILFIDLDDFKNINDFLGHDSGDKVLKIVSKTVKSSVRDIDFVSRIGGDEFVVILPEFHDDIEIAEIAERIIKNISKPITIKNKNFNIGASVGIVLYPKNGQNKNELIKNADIAMYEAKKLGKNQYFFFTSKLNEVLHEKMYMMDKIKKALKEDSFELYYQAKIDAKDEKIVGCEALIRWNDPELGFVTPDKFIPLAEENGYIVEIGEWVIKESVNQVNKWKNTLLKDIKLSFNVSAKQLQDANFYDKLYNYTKNMDIDKLEMEITETLFFDNFKDNVKIIEKVKKLGITIAMDDFGTGYSSLSYLRDIPIDTLKIDKSFLDAFESENGKSFIEMIIKIAKILSLKVVAEGVEKQEQVEFLKSLQCDMYQGYYFSKPLKLKDFEKLVTSQL